MKTVYLPEEFDNIIASKLQNPSNTAYKSIKAIDCKCINVVDGVDVLCVILEHSIKITSYDWKSNGYITTYTNRLYIGEFTLEKFNITMDELISLIKNKKTVSFDIIQEFVDCGESYTSIFSNRTHVFDTPRYVNIITKIEEEL